MNTSNPSVTVKEMPGGSASREVSRPGSRQSFLSFLIEKGANRKFLIIALIGSIIQLIIFKLCYPFPDFMSDSYNYLESAMYHMNANIWPIGYAKFLSLVHLFSASDLLLVSIQYGIVQVSLLYFFYTILFLYNPSGLTRKILFFVTFFNPASLYLSNYVLSDALFGSITIVWISILLRLLNSRNRVWLLAQVVLMGLAFTFRYTAVFYPLVAVVALLFVPIRWPERILWMAAPALLFLPFIRFTRAQTYAVTGTPEFSVFAGWQIANNALYMYEHIRVDSAKLPPETRELDRMAKQYYMEAPPGYINLDDFDGTFFIKHPDAPLKQYMYIHYLKEARSNVFLSWGKVSPIYNTYGSWLVLHYPLAFTRYYLLRNTKFYLYPFLAQMGLYNMGDDSFWDAAQSWFQFSSPRARSISKDFQGVVFFAYPPTFLLLNIYFAGCLVWLFVSRKFDQLQPGFKKALWLIIAFWVINFAFSIFATPVVLRYEIVPMLFLFCFSLLLLEFTDFKKPRQERYT